MTKFELTRTAGRWRPRSRTYVGLAILVVTACSTNAKDSPCPTPSSPPARSGTISGRKRGAARSGGRTLWHREDEGRGLSCLRASQTVPALFARTCSPAKLIGFLEFVGTPRRNDARRCPPDRARRWRGV